MNIFSSFKQLAVDKVDINGIGLPSADPNTLLPNGFKLATMAIGALAVIFIIIGGFQYMTADGDAGKIKNAKNTIIYAAIGIVVVLIASSVIAFVGSTVQGQ